MNLAEAVNILNNRQYRNEMTKEERQAFKDAGIVVVYGASDDLMEFDGAWRDEAGASTVLLHSKGIEYEEDFDCCKYSRKIGKSLPKIEAIFAPKEPRCTFMFGFHNIPNDFKYMVFNIMEDDDLYCVGVVFYANQLPEI